MRSPTARALLLVALLSGCSEHAELWLGTSNEDAAAREASSDAQPALRLTGSDARVALAHTAEFDLTDHFTFEAWVWPFATGAGEMLLCKSDQQREGKSVRLVGETRAPAVSLEMTSAPSPASLTPSVGLATQGWHHLALGYAEGQLQLFVNGNLVSQLSRNDPVVDGSGTLYLGACLTDQWLPSSDVALSDVRFSRIARYSSDFAPEPRLAADADAMALYRLDEGKMFTATDAGPHGLDASINGSAQWVRLPLRSAR